MAAVYGYDIAGGVKCELKGLEERWQVFRGYLIAGEGRAEVGVNVGQ